MRRALAQIDLNCDKCNTPIYSGAYFLTDSFEEEVICFNCDPDKEEDL